MINLTLIFGGKGSGKTTYVRNFVQEQMGKGKKIIGVFSEFRFEHPSKQVYNAVLIPTFERFLLCRANKIHNPNFSDWKFYPETFDICSKYILGNIGLAECIVIDEIGQLELEKKGWHPIVSKLLIHYDGDLILTGRFSRLDVYYKDFIQKRFFKRLSKVYKFTV